MRNQPASPATIIAGEVKEPLGRKCYRLINSSDRSVVVLGMHRSGTSVVTRVINLLGLPLCRENDIYSAPDNPTGHWESTSLVAFNDRLLGMLGGGFTAPPVIDDGWECKPAAVVLRDEADKIFRQAHPTPAWVWKDPRTCLTLPFWRSVWPQVPIAVLVHREPLQVSDSLRRRDGFGKAHCIALWERYARSGLRSAAGLPLVSVRFDELIADPFAATTDLGDRLSRLGVSPIDDVDEAARFVAARQAAGRCVSPGLADDPDATVAQRALLATISALPRISDCFAPPELGAESASTTELLAVIGEHHGCQQTFRATAREVWPAFRRAVSSRLQHGEGRFDRPWVPPR